MKRMNSIKTALVLLCLFVVQFGYGQWEEIEDCIYGPDIIAADLGYWVSFSDINLNLPTATVPAAINMEFEFSEPYESMQFDFKVNNYFPNQGLDFEGYDYEANFGYTALGFGWYRACLLNDALESGGVIPATDDGSYVISPSDPIIIGPGSVVVVDGKGGAPPPAIMKYFESYLDAFDHYSHCHQGYEISITNVLYSTQAVYECDQPNWSGECGTNYSNSFYIGCRDDGNDVGTERLLANNEQFDMFFNNETKLLQVSPTFNTEVQSTLTIVNTNGSLLMNENITNETLRYSLNDLETGIYFAIVSTENKTQQLKFVVK